MIRHCPRCGEEVTEYDIVCPFWGGGTTFATPTEDYQVVKDVMIAKMKQQKLEEWIKNKQKNTYIRINENWCDCEFQYPGWVKK